MCYFQSCSKYWENNKNSLAGKCAVLFEDNCCDDDDELYIITNNEANKLRGIGFSGGVGPFGFQDDTEVIHSPSIIHVHSVFSLLLFVLAVPWWFGTVLLVTRMLKQKQQAVQRTRVKCKS